MDFTTLSLDELLGTDFSTLSAEDITACEAEIRSRFAAIKAAATPTKAQIADAKAMATALPEVLAARDALAGAEDADEGEVAELAELSLDDDEDAEDEGESEEGDEDEAEADEGDAEDEADEGDEDAVEDEPEAAAKPVAAAKKKTAAFSKTKTTTARAKLAGARPAVPAPDDKQLVTITAAADTQFATGSNIDLGEVGQAVIHRLSGMPAPSGDGTSEDLRTFGVAKVAVPYPTEFQVNPRMDEEAIDEVLQHAIDETRLEGNSLVASNGWCAPSETLYDLCAGEVVDGILSVPEVQVNRGGFKHTTGIDFSTIYSGVGFLQTEAQAISGTTKASYEVPCPTFTDERLDAIGLFLKVPILLEQGYPEVVKRIMSGSMIAHQYKVNASVISRILTIAGAATNFTPDLTSVMFDSLNGLDLQAEQTRQSFRLGASASLEVVLPVWAKSVYRNDIGARTGRTPEAVSDAEINAHFAARHYNVQFVYGWQELTGSEVTWPATVEYLMYPAGTLVKGVSDVINLSAVYDAASLAVNIYTGLFFEQGLLVAKMCYGVKRGTITVTAAYSGKTGAASL